MDLPRNSPISRAHKKTKQAHKQANKETPTNKEPKANPVSSALFCVSNNQGQHHHISPGL